MWCMLQEYGDDGFQPAKGRSGKKRGHEAEQTESESDGEGTGTRKRAMPSVKRSAIRALASARLSAGGAK
jgi:hypothetical protein